MSEGESSIDGSITSVGQARVRPSNLSNNAATPDSSYFHNNDNLKGLSADRASSIGHPPIHSSNDYNYSGIDGSHRAPTNVSDLEDESSIEKSAEISKLLHPMPICNKITQFLVDRGLPSVHLIASDIDSSSNTVSIFVMESWAETVLSALQEADEKMKMQQATMKSFTMSARLDEVSKDSLMSKITNLEKQIQDYKRKESLASSKLTVVEDQLLSNSKADSRGAVELKKQVRNVEAQLQEADRRVRRKDLEIERLKQKLAQIVQKERETHERNRYIIRQIKTGDLSFMQDKTFIHSPALSPQSKNANNSKSTLNKSSSKINSSFRSEGSSNSGNRKSMKEEVPISSLVEALETQRAELFSRNTELEYQVKDLVGTLQKQQNEWERTNFKRYTPSPKQSTSIHQNSNNATGINEGYEAEYSEASESDIHDNDVADMRSATAQRMYQTIRIQEERIEHLQHELEVSKAIISEREESGSAVRRRMRELHEEIENLRLELESRPSVRQWNEIQRERDSLEERLHDLIMLREESQEISMWRKHLSTQDRIKVDKRNHELGLWLLDSLPKATMKEVLQSVCRELDISEISEIHPSIVKLKAVVKTIPRMERFISQVCTFIYQRHPTLGDIDGLRNNGNIGRDDHDQFKNLSEYRMEHILPILRRWWYAAQRCVELDAFYNRTLLELYRRQEILARKSIAEVPSDRNAKHPQHIRSSVEMDLLKEQWQKEGRYLWQQKDIEGIFEIIRDLVDFQAEVMHHDQSLVFAEDYIRQRPELIINRVVGHIQYLFEIKGIDGVIPRMNQVYLFVEEMRNFLTTVKGLLSNGASMGRTVAFTKDGAVSNALVLAEIQRRLTTPSNVSHAQLNHQ